MADVADRQAAVAQIGEREFVTRGRHAAAEGRPAGLQTLLQRAFAEIERHRRASEVGGGVADGFLQPVHEPCLHIACIGGAGARRHPVAQVRGERGVGRTQADLEQRGVETQPACGRRKHDGAGEERLVERRIPLGPVAELDAGRRFVARAGPAREAHPGAEGFLHECRHARTRAVPFERHVIVMRDEPALANGIHQMRETGLVGEHLAERRAVAQQKPQRAPAIRLGGHAEFKAEQRVVQRGDPGLHEAFVVRRVDRALGVRQRLAIEPSGLRQGRGVEPLGVEIGKQGTKHGNGDGGLGHGSWRSDRSFHWRRICA